MAPVNAIFMLFLLCPGRVVSRLWGITRHDIGQPAEPVKRELLPAEIGGSAERLPRGYTEAVLASLFSQAGAHRCAARNSSARWVCCSTRRMLWPSSLIEPGRAKRTPRSQVSGSIQAMARRASAPWAGRASRVRWPAFAARRLTAPKLAGGDAPPDAGSDGRCRRSRRQPTCIAAMERAHKKIFCTVRLITMHRPSGTSTGPLRTRRAGGLSG